MRYSAPAAATTAAAATTTTAAATTVAAAAAAATGTGAILTGTCFVDVDGTTAEIDAVEGLDCCVGLAGVGHLNEGKASRTAGFAVSDDRNIGHFAMSLKGIANVVFSSAEREVSNKELHERFLCPAK